MSYNAEKESWALPHKLLIDKTRGETYLWPLLDNFGPRLLLCYQDRNLMGIDYQHWFVKDKMSPWIIEFAGGIENNHVNVHTNPPGEFSLELEFANTQEVKQRMKNVCAAKNYSLALRNCEHVARYVQAGVWVSFQTIPKGHIMKKFFNDLAEKTKMINSFPEELQPPNESFAPIYPQISDFVQCGGPKDALTEKDKKAFNILVFGPTGAGKSTIINHIYNMYVCPVSSGPQSKTRRVHYTQGGYFFGKKWKTVNIIDTIGLCDSMLKDEEVHQFIETSLKINLMHIDKVLVLCFDRITQPHVQSIQQFLKLLEYHKRKANFIFVYTKCEEMSEEDRETNIEDMVDMLDYGDDDKESNQPERITTGLPPSSELTDEMQEDLVKLKSLVLTPSPKQLLIDKSKCRIM